MSDSNTPAAVPIQSQPWPPDLAASMAEALANRLFEELTRLGAPPSAVELLYGLEFFTLYQSGAHTEAMQSDFAQMLHSSVLALAETGGLR